MSKNGSNGKSAGRYLVVCDRDRERLAEFKRRRKSRTRCADQEQEHDPWPDDEVTGVMAAALEDVRQMTAETLAELAAEVAEARQEVRRSHSPPAPVPVAEPAPADVPSRG